MALDGIYVFDEKEKKYKKDLRPNTNDVTKTQKMKFVQFGLKRNLLKGIYSAEYLFPSPIQQEAIPAILSKQNILARAKNGTGKTAAYAIPAIHLVDPHNSAPQVLVIVPSRELALQTSSVFEKLANFCQINVSLSIGGTSVDENIVESEKSHIIVGTLGRISHLLKQNPDLLKDCKIIAIDEADVLLTKNVLQSVEQIISKTPQNRQLLLFSATFPLYIKSFSDKWMKNAVKINTMECLTLKGVTSFYVYLEKSEKQKCLWYLIRKLNINQSIIFVNTVTSADKLTEMMKNRNYNCVCIHSQMPQEQRIQIYNDFKNGKYRHLISTDLFTRGIDISAVNVVVNYDFPTSADIYLHRIGRSGRFGQVGLSIELVTDEDKANFYNIEKVLDIDVQQLPEKIDLKLYN